jgi:ABC-2 type transport system ATP-binding protein
LSTTQHPVALAATGLGKRYRRGWALRDCAFELPAGRVGALVGPNGAGKTTLMMIADGLVTPTAGTIRVLGHEPGTRAPVSFLSQGKPLYRFLTVTEMLRAGRELNPGWDQAYAERLVREADVPLRAKIGSLSGGQQSRVALALALARRPQLVLLDEPLADLDPLARQQVMQTLMAEVADTGMTVLLSSHVLADLEGVCDFLLLLGGGRVRLAGGVDDLLSTHRLLTGAQPAGAAALELTPHTVVEARTRGRRSRRSSALPACSTTPTVRPRDARPVPEAAGRVMGPAQRVRGPGREHDRHRVVAAVQYRPGRARLPQAGRLHGDVPGLPRSGPVLDLPADRGRHPARPGSDAAGGRRLVAAYAPALSAVGQTE